MNAPRCATSVTSWLALCWLVGDAISLEVLMATDRVHAEKGEKVSILCQAEEVTSVVDCQFRVWFVGEGEEGVLVVATNDESDKYVGHFQKNLTTGGCSVTLLDLPGNDIHVSCQLMTANETAVKTTFIKQSDRRKVSVNSSISCAFLVMLLVILVVALVVVAAVQRRVCFEAQRYADIKSQASKCDSCIPCLKPRGTALTPSARVVAVQPENGQPQRRQHRNPLNAQAVRRHRPGPAHVSDPRARSTPKTAPTTPPPQVQVVQSRREGHAKPNHVNHATTPRTGEALYANATELTRVYRNDDHEEAEYLNVSEARKLKRLHGTQVLPVPILPQKTKQSTQASQLVPFQDPGLALQNDSEKVPRSVVTSPGLPSIRGKDIDDKVIYAELLINKVAAPRAKSTTPKEEVIYAELDFGR